MTRRKPPVPAPDPDRDLPDPGYERPLATCRDCGATHDNDRIPWCDRCAVVGGDDDDT